MSLLIAHSRKNQQSKNVREQTEQRIDELNAQFVEFLHTKGIAAKFRLAFSGMAESAARQRDKDRARFEEVKRQSAENNKEFVEFLHTKGIGAKFRLVVKNIKEGTKNAPQNTAAQIAKAKANAAANIPHSGKSVSPVRGDAAARELAEQFEAFLKEKGLDTEYSVEITEEE